MKNFLKQFYWVILGIFLLGVVFSAPALKQWNNSKFELSQYRMLFTDTGLPNGTPVMDINSWWSNISHWPLLDWELNPYITWYSETDPVFNSWLLTPPNVSTFVNDAGYSNIDVQTNNFPVWVPWWLTWSMLWKVWNDSLWVYNTTLTTDSFHSFAFWRQSHIDWTWTFAMWLWTKAINDDMVVMGRFNDWLVWTILEIGKWTSDIDRQNALTILDNGNVWIGTTWPANILEINWEASYTNTWDMGTDDTDFASKWYVDWELWDYLPLAGNSEITAISGDVYFEPARTLQRWEVGVLNGYINYSDVSKEISMNSYDLSTNKNGFIRIQDGYPEMWYSHAGSFRFVKLQTWWLVYQADYSGDYTNRSLVDKEYVDTVTDEYIPRTAVDTGFNNTGSDTIIPSEKAVWSLVSWLNNNYVPFWDGNKFINSSIFKTTDFLSLANITWAFLRIHDDFIYASTDIVDWKITENRFRIWTPDSWTTGVYVEWKMLDWVMDIYADTGVYVKSKYFSAISWAAEWDYSIAMWRNANATWKNAVALWEFARAYWDSSISMWNQVTAVAPFSTALWRNTEARSAYWVVMGNYNEWNTDSLLEIGDGTSAIWYNEFEFKKDGRFIISNEWSFILNASGNLDVQYLSGSSWETAYTFTKS